MILSRIGKALLVPSLLVAAFVAATHASGIDLFGRKKEPTSSSEIFWSEGSSEEAGAPTGILIDFADMSERVSPGVVNIKTAKTISAQAIPRSFE